MKLGVASIALLATVSAHARPTVRWDETFRATSIVHFHARYTEQGEGHRIDVWRTSVRVRRDTDDRVSVVATEEPEDVRIDVLDRRRDRLFHTRRGSLARNKILIDAFELRTGMRKPGGPHSIERSGREPIEGRSACRWSTITTPMEKADVCWSERWGIPMRIEQSGRPVFVVDAVEERTASDLLFRLSGD